MHIGIDASRSVGPQRTGTEGYSLHLIRALLALDAASEYTLYFNRPPAAGLFPPRLNLRQRVIPFPRLWTHLRLAAEIAVCRPEVLFIPAHTLPWWHPCPTVVTVHDLGYQYFPWAHPRLARWYLHLSTLFSARTATRVIADSAATKADLVQRYRIPPAKVTVVPLAAGPAFRPVAPEAAQATARRYGITGEYILFVGTLHPRKNLRRLLEAFALLKRQAHLPHRLVLAGKLGWRGQELCRTAAQLGLEGQVVFTGFVAEEDLPALMSGCAAFAFPSLYEGFGLPALEAMACGAPVICSDSASLPEVVGNAGLLVDPWDTAALAQGLHRLITDEELRGELKARGLERAAQFSWPRCAHETLAVLKTAAQEG